MLFVGIAAGVTVGLALILIVLLITIVISRKRYLYLASHLLSFVREQFTDCTSSYKSNYYTVTTTTATSALQEMICPPANKKQATYQNYRFMPE
jgi:uncharacterized protein YpmS